MMEYPPSNYQKGADIPFFSKKRSATLRSSTQAGALLHKVKEGFFMRKMFKRASVVMPVAAMAFSLIACGGTAEQGEAGTAATQLAGESSTEAKTSAEDNSTDEQVTLHIYTNYTDEASIQQMDYSIDEMKKVMPNVTLEIEPAAQDDDAKLKTMMATGDLPDIFGTTRSNLDVAIKSNSILQLDDYVRELNLEETLTPSTMSYLEQQDGHTWIIPTENSTFGLIYVNKSIFEKAGVEIPQNYEELLATADTFNQQGIIPMCIWLKESWPPLQLFDMVSITENPDGIKALDINGDALPSDPAYQHAAEKIVEMVNAGIFSKDAFTMDYDSALAQFLNGEAAMMMGGSWTAQEFGEKLGEDNVEILLPYVFADPDQADVVKSEGRMSGGGFSGGYAVSANAENPEVAAKYAIQLALKNIEGRIVKVGENNTAFLNPPESETPQNQVVMTLGEAVAKAQTTTMMGWAFESAAISTDLGSEVQKLYTGTYSAEDFVKNAAAVVEKARNGKG